MPKEKLTPGEHIQKVKAMYDRTSESRKDKLNYLKTYRQNNKEAISEARKTRYQTDEVYRKACKKRANDAYKRRRATIRKMRALGVLPKHSRGKPNTSYCPTCFRPLPRKNKPVEMLIAKQYLVMMFNVGELARSIGKTSRTVVSWIENKNVPEARFKNAAGRRLWTQDEVETYMEIVSGFDLRPPVSFKASGFSAKITNGLNNLYKGIDVSKYTEKTENGYLRRKDQELPPPITSPDHVPTVKRYGKKKLAS